MYNSLTAIRDLDCRNCLKLNGVAAEKAKIRQKGIRSVDGGSEGCKWQLVRHYQSFQSLNLLPEYQQITNKDSALMDRIIRVKNGPL